MALRIPKAYVPLTAAVQAPAKAVKVEARIDMSAEVAGLGLCPDCKSPMEEVYLDDDAVLSCISCRIVLPKKDPEPEVLPTPEPMNPVSDTLQ